MPPAPPSVSVPPPTIRLRWTRRAWSNSSAIHVGSAARAVQRAGSGQALRDQVTMLFRLGAQSAIMFFREVAFDAPEPVAQRGVIGGPVQRGPQPAGQPAHPAIGLFSAGKRVEPDLKRGLPGRF